MEGIALAHLKALRAAPVWRSLESYPFYAPNLEAAPRPLQGLMGLLTER